MACADGPGDIFESNESDNCMASSTTVQIVDAPVAPGLPTGLGQFKAGGTTALPVGAWTNQTTVVLRFTMTDASRTDSLVPEVEIKPVTTAPSTAAACAREARWHLPECPSRAA